MSTPVPTIETDPFWLNKVSILFRSDRLTEFMPVVDHSIEERMNALARFGIYLTIILVSYKRDFTFTWILPVILLITYSVYKKYKSINLEGLDDTENKIEDEIPKSVITDALFLPVSDSKTRQWRILI